jgi:hypothetical protein
MIATNVVPASAATAWRDVVMPKEHGSWSLAFEPVALGLLIAPSGGGAMLAFAVAAAFFSRRPLTIATRDHRPARRASARNALMICAVVATLFLVAAFSIEGAAWTAWLIPSAIAGAVFLGFDLRRGGREEAAEVAGAAAFAFLPAAFVALSNDLSISALSVALMMLGRAVPTVLCVRTFLRGAKTGERGAGVALAASAAALAVGIMLARAGLAPRGAVVLLALLSLRAFALLVFPRPALRARTLGMIEAITGIVFVAALAALWRT